MTGLKFVQIMKNTRHHSGINRTPYAAVFSKGPTVAYSHSTAETTDAESTGAEVAEAESTGTEVTEADELEDIPNQEASEHFEQIFDHIEEVEDIPNHEASEHFEHIFDHIEEVNLTLNERDEEISFERSEARKRQLSQSEVMLERSIKRFRPAQVGDSVIVPIPEVDKSRGDANNLMAVVVQSQKDGFYTLGTRHGILKQLYTRNQFEVCQEQHLLEEDVPRHEIGLREAANKSSMFGGQGFTRCNCHTKCLSNRCACKKRKILCNSKCHSGLSCCNK